MGGSNRVDSRSIAASIVPFLRLPHPQDIYNFIVSGSLCWGIVEMSTHYNTLPTRYNTLPDSTPFIVNSNNSFEGIQTRPRTYRYVNEHTPESREFNINRVPNTRRRAASDPISLRNIPNTRVRAVSAPTFNTIDDYGLTRSNYEYGISDKNWKTLEEYSRIHPDIMSNGNETRLKHFKALKQKIINAYTTKKQAYNKLNQSKIRNTFKLQYPFSLRETYRKSNVTITNNMKKDIKSKLVTLYNTMKLTPREMNPYKQGQKLFINKTGPTVFSIKDDIFMHIKKYKDIKIKYNEIYDLLNKTNTPDYQKLITEISQFRKTLQTLLIDAPLENNVSFFNKILKSIVYRPVKYDLYVLTKLSDKLEDCLILLRQLSNKT